MCEVVDNITYLVVVENTTVPVPGPDSWARSFCGDDPRECCSSYSSIGSPSGKAKRIRFVICKVLYPWATHGSNICNYFLDVSDSSLFVSKSECATPMDPRWIYRWDNKGELMLSYSCSLLRLFNEPHVVPTTALYELKGQVDIRYGRNVIFLKFQYFLVDYSICKILSKSIKKF